MKYIKRIKIVGIIFWFFWLLLEVDHLFSVSARVEFLGEPLLALGGYTGLLAAERIESSVYLFEGCD